MHSLLETYLADVARRLGPLPVARREEELREMRQHLLHSWSVHRESGQTIDEAAVCAVEQLGTPQELAGHLVWSWRREQRRDIRQLCGAVLSAPLLLWGLTLLNTYCLFSALAFLCPSLGTFFWHHRKLCADFVDGLFYLNYVLTGSVLGAVVPKQAVRGMAWGAAVYECGYLIWLGKAVYECGYMIWLGKASISRLSFLSEHLVWALTGVCFAWAVSRLRRRAERNEAS